MLDMRDKFMNLIDIEKNINKLADVIENETKEIGENFIYELLNLKGTKPNIQRPPL